MAPLLVAHDATGHIHLIIGANSLANARCARSLAIGATPIIIAPPSIHMHYALKQRVDSGQVKWLQKQFEDEDLKTLGRPEIDGYVDAVFVTKTGAFSINNHISSTCRKWRIPVNVVDSQNLSSFTLLSTHSDGPLQIGITTSGKGCKLASRIRREIASTLPPNFGSAVERLGTMRRKIWEEDHKAHDLAEFDGDASDDESTGQKASFNQLILDSDHDAAKSRRIRWLSQICEYWPLRKLAAITDEDIDTVLESYKASIRTMDGDVLVSGVLEKPQVILAGSGPGNPDLLTVATRNAIQSAGIILADKLVPAPVLDLIPRRTPVHIARKFPGNAEAAQQELLELGLEALKKGMTVLRLKQGDPYLYGRGGEEFTFFESQGYKPIVLPGITSALSAPLFAAIPATHRSVSDQVLICTGTGRKGVAPTPPTYVKTQTVVFLMALHRISSLVDSLVGEAAAGEGKATTMDGFVPWPASTPCAVIERASCADQRVIRTTLEHVVTAIEQEGSRPPGLLVLGHACEVLRNPGGSKWMVEEGITALPALDISPAPVAITA